MECQTGAGDVEIRPFETADAAAVELVRQAVRAAEPQAWLPVPEPGTPSAMVALHQGSVVAYTWAERWLEEDGTRLWLNLGFVDPAWRRRGIGRALLARQEAVARQASLADPDPRVEQEVLGGNADVSATRALLEAGGYKVAFSVITLRAELTAAPPPPLPSGLSERDLGEDEHNAIFAAIGECFGSSRLGYVAHTWEAYRREMSHPQLCCVAWDGDEVAGLVIVEPSDGGQADVPWVAVRPAWRRRGLARTLMRIAMARSAREGMTAMTIRTVLENPQRTVDLYQSLGFTVTERQPRYRKNM